MVDPNPARGMPIALQKYWLGGKGAAKIRWRLPGDFNRCVRNLRKYFPTNPEGLCNILHQKAVGAPPGKGHGEHSIDMYGASYSRESLVAATELLQRQPKLGQHTWAGPLAPIGRPTQEPRRIRVFEKGSLDHRILPRPLDWRKFTSQGHDGALTVARILGVSYGPDHRGLDYAWGWGDYLDEEIIPEARQARYLADMGVVGTSLDPGGAIAATLNHETGAEHMHRYTIGGATLVPIPAFSEMSIFNFSPDVDDWPDDDPDLEMALEEEKDCGCGSVVAAVNPSGWRGLPLAPRESVFDNDDAIKRIAAWANVGPQGADVARLRRAFMYYDPQQPETALTSYRLPVGDIVNGQLTLIYHAIYAAAALLSGAHGGLPNVPDQDKGTIRRVISEIYPVMAKEFNDPSIRAPWDRSAQEGIQLSITYASDPKEPYGDVQYADPGYQADGKKRYPLDSEEHCRAAWSYINMPKNAEKYTPEQLKKIKARIQTALKKYGVETEGQKSSAKDEYSMIDTTYPVEPPKAWFEDPGLSAKTPLTVDSQGRVFGHLAAWGECHRDFLDRQECVLAPKSKKDYAPFHLGTVLTAEGEVVRVGKIVMDTRHASINLGYSSAALHYDNTGDEVAVVRAGEDQYGIWVAGAIVPEADPRRVAKLRRSPISGDWRRVDGNLELTAALAVNVPAFPVYSMEGEEQLALVAAGSVLPEELLLFEDDEPVKVTEVPPAPPTGIDISLVASQVLQEVARRQEIQDRADRLADLREDHEIYDRRRREARLAQVYAAAGIDPPPVAPAPPAVAPVAPVAPVDPAAVPAEGTEDQAGMLARQLDFSPYSIVEGPAGDDTEGADQGATPAGPTVPAPVAAAPPAPVPAG